MTLIISYHHYHYTIIIGQSTFRGCSSLKNITIDSKAKLTYIPNQFCSQCNALESISIPTSVTSIGIITIATSNHHNNNITTPRIECLSIMQQADKRYHSYEC